MKIKKTLTLLTGIILPFSMVFAGPEKDDFKERPIIYGSEKQSVPSGEVINTQVKLSIEGLIEQNINPGAVKTDSYLGRLSSKDAKVTFTVGLFNFSESFENLANAGVTDLTSTIKNGDKRQLTVGVEKVADVVLDSATKEEILVVSYRIRPIELATLPSEDEDEEEKLHVGQHSAVVYITKKNKILLNSLPAAEVELSVQGAVNENEEPKYVGLVQPNTADFDYYGLLPNEASAIVIVKANGFEFSEAFVNLLKAKSKELSATNGQPYKLKISVDIKTVSIETKSDAVTGTEAHCYEINFDPELIDQTLALLNDNEKLELVSLNSNARNDITCGLGDSDKKDAEAFLGGIPIYMSGFEQEVDGQKIKIEVLSDILANKCPFSFPKQFEDAEFSGFCLVKPIDGFNGPIQLKGLIDGKEVFSESWIDNDLIANLVTNVSKYYKIDFFNLEKTKKFTMVINCYVRDMNSLLGDNTTTEGTYSSLSITVGRKPMYQALIVKVNEVIFETVEEKKLPPPPESQNGNEPKPLPLHINSESISRYSVTFELKGDPDAVASASNLEDLMKRKVLKIAVNTQVLELIPNYGPSDRAILQSIAKDICVIRIVSGSMQRFFDITILNNSGNIEIGDIREVSKQEYSADVARQEGFFKSVKSGN